MARQLHGDALARPLQKTELKKHLDLVTRTLKANSSNPAIQQTLQDIQDLLNRSVEAASYIRSKPRASDVASRVALELARLQNLGVTSFEILSTVLAVQLLDAERALKPAAVFFCAIARHLVVLRKHGDRWKNDKRYGTRPERMSRNARIDIGRRFAQMVAPLFGAIEATINGAVKAKQQRLQAIYQALADQPLVPPKLRARTSGTVIATARAK
jgi:hypothetical protein